MTEHASRFYLIEWMADGMARSEPSFSIVVAYRASDAVMQAKLRQPLRDVANVQPYEPSWPNHFEWKSGSKMWPPLDRNDSPFDEFTCKHCGEKLSVQMYGTFPIGQAPEVEVKLKTERHLRRCSGRGK